MNRFEMKCPKCKVGNNTKDHGGNKNCFHCDSCYYVECEVDGTRWVGNDLWGNGCIP